MAIKDDKLLVVIRRDLSGGQDTRRHGSNIAENQATVLYNADIQVKGQTKKRPGSVLIGDDVSNNDVVALHNYEIQGETDQLLMYEGTNLRKWVGTGNWSSLKADFSASQTDVGICSIKESGLSPDDVVIVQNGTDNAFRIDTDGNEQDLGSTSGTGSDSPPTSQVMAWYGNRLWVLKNDLLYYSDAYSSDYSSAFDTTSNYFRIPVGEERGIVPTRDFGMIIGGEQSIWSLFPSATPAATDRPEPILANVGVVSKNAMVVAGDDIYFFSHDGLRALRRTVQDKLQTGTSLPVSFPLKDEFEKINWSYISQLSMIYWDNKIFINVPTGANTYRTWIYYPAHNSFMITTGWTPRCMAKYKVSGEERLYYGKDGDGTVYRGWHGYTDEGTTQTNGTAINYQEEGRKEDFGQPLIKKSGGTLKVKAYSSGDYDLTISASADDQEYSQLGTMNLAGTAPTLPATLPFDLAATNLVTEEFHLDSLGEFDQLRIKIQHNATNSSDDIKLYERSITTYPLEYQNE